MTEQSYEIILTPAELAQRLRVSVQWVYKRTARGQENDPLPVLRVGKSLRFSWADVRKWLERNSRN